MERTVYISGSFKRDAKGMEATIREFEAIGFTVLSPKSLVIVSQDMNLPGLLRNHYPERIQIMQKTVEELNNQRTTTAIAKSDVFYMYNPGGNIDTENALELGLALGYGKLTFAEETLNDTTLREFCPVATMSHILNQVSIIKEKIISKER